MTAVTFRPGEEEAVPPSRSRRGFMLPTLPSKFGERETAPARKAPASSVTEAVCFVPPARLRSGVFPDGWERSAPRSFKAPRTAPKAGTKVRRRPTIMRTWGQLPRRTIPSRGPGKTRSAAAIPAQADRAPRPSAVPKTPRTGLPVSSAEVRGTRNCPPARLRPFPPDFRQPPFRRPRRTQTAPAVFPPVRASRLSRAASSTFPGRRGPLFAV